MRIGAFEVSDDLPTLREPHAIAMLRPWIDAGSVGALVLAEVERQYGTERIASLARPDAFYDYTRYRPTVYLKDGHRSLSVPNTVVSVARPPTGPDLVLVKMLEPHMFAGRFIESVLRLLASLGVRRYHWLGSMYDMVPHTRPLLISGGAIGENAERDVQKLGILPTDYQGPSTLTFQIVQRAPMMGIESMWSVVHLPQYVQVDEDYVGKLRLMELLRSLYGLEIDDADTERAREQFETIEEAMAENPDLAATVPHFESRYQAMLDRPDGDRPPLSFDVERFLEQVGDDDGRD
jgi:hypothetical protein